MQRLSLIRRRSRKPSEVAKENLKLRTHVDADGTETEIQKLKRRIENMRAEVKTNARLDEDSKKKLEERLKNIRSQVRLSTDDGDLAKIHKQVSAAAKDIRTEIKLNKEAEARIRQQIKALSQDIPVGAKLDAGARKNIEHQLESIRAKANVDANLTAEQKKRIEHELNKLKGKATVNADLDDGKARFDLARLTRDRWVTINARIGKASIARAAAQLKALAGGNVFESIGRNLNDFLRNLDTASVKIGAVSTLIGTAVSTIGAGLGVFSSLSVGLAKSTPALLALPGIFGAAAAGAGVLIAALKDTKTVLADLGRRSLISRSRALDLTGAGRPADPRLRERGYQGAVSSAQQYRHKSWFHDCCYRWCGERTHPGVSAVSRLPGSGTLCRLDGSGILH